jgi:adenylosuccinate lyase
MAELGTVPREAAAAVWERGRFEVDRIDAIEAETRHDVIAFLTNVAEHVGEPARFLHQGMTSSDVLDTCLPCSSPARPTSCWPTSTRCSPRSSAAPIEHKMTPTIGRSHGIHAEPVTFGLKLAAAYAEFARNRDRLAAGAGGDRDLRDLRRGRARSPISTRGRGACRRQDGLTVEPISPRSSRATGTRSSSRVLAVIASSVERLAWRSATCSAPKCWKRRNISRRARRARRACRTSATRC